MESTYEHENAPALDSSDQLSAGWLTSALQHCSVLQAEETVVAVQAQAFAVGVAMLSDLCRVTPTYEPASVAERPGVPSSLVVKFAASSDAKEITDSYGGYQQEIRFYREIAPRLGTVRLGPCLYTAMSPTEQRYTLVFDDLATNASLTPGDQVTGCTVAQATAAARCYARLHAAFWESPALSTQGSTAGDPIGNLSWIVSPTEPRWSALVSPFMQEHADGAFLDQELPPEAGLSSDDEDSKSVRRLSVPPGTKEMLHRIATHWDWLNAEMASAPCTLTHWDSRTDNLFFDVTKSPGSVESAIIIDWQMIQRQRGAHDIAMLLATSLPVEERREHDRNILAAYHQELQACGVSADAYGEGQLYRDFRLGLMTASQHPAFAAVNLYGRNERAVALAMCTVTRFYTAMMDHKVVEELPVTQNM